MKLSENRGPQVEFCILVHSVDLRNVQDMSLRKKEMVQKDADLRIQLHLLVCTYVHKWIQL